MLVSFFFFNDTATTEIYTLSLHDALPILARLTAKEYRDLMKVMIFVMDNLYEDKDVENFVKNEDLVKIYEAWNEMRSEEHTSELQSQSNLVCRLLLEKKKKTTTTVSGHTR